MLAIAILMLVSLPQRVVCLGLTKLSFFLIQPSLSFPSPLMVLRFGVWGADDLFEAFLGLLSHRRLRCNDLSFVSESEVPSSSSSKEGFVSLIDLSFFLVFFLPGGSTRSKNSECASVSSEQTVLSSGTSKIDPSAMKSRTDLKCRTSPSLSPGATRLEVLFGAIFQSLRDGSRLALRRGWSGGADNSTISSSKLSF